MYIPIKETLAMSFIVDNENISPRALTINLNPSKLILSFNFLIKNEISYKHFKNN